MSEHSTIQYERTSPQVAKITFANPPVNLIAGETVLRLIEIVGELATDPDIQVVVFDSATPDFFYNHFDLAAAADFPAPEDRAAVAGMDESGPGTLQGALHHHRGHPWTHPRRWERARPRPRSALRQPGASDLRAARGRQRTAARRRRDRTAPRAIGRDRALEVILTSDDYDADTAERWGWITRALPDSELDAFVDTVVARLASFDRTSLAAAKAQINRASLPPDADLVAAYGEFSHSLTLPGFLTRAAGTQAVVEQAGIDSEYRLGHYIGVANQRR